MELSRIRRPNDGSAAKNNMSSIVFRGRRGSVVDGEKSEAEAKIYSRVNWKCAARFRAINLAGRV